MKKNVLRFLTVITLVLCGAFTAAAQVVLTGTVLDAESNQPIVGVSVTTGQGQTLRGTTTDLNGRFHFDVPANATKVSFRSVGYETVDKALRFSGAKTVDLGTILLHQETVNLGTVEVIASVIPKDRRTPVPVANVTVERIEAKTFNSEFPEILKSTPSVYVTRGNGGFGDSRITLRGFSTENIGVMINGVPVNDMENGKVYWSNWAGLTDVASLVQIQRGLGASRLGISSVGGTINIVTKNVDAKQGGNVFMGVGNDGYMKYGFNVSTGLMDNGWAISASGNTSYGDGWAKATNFRSYSYFINISKKFNEAHTLSFTAFGAPQWHNQRYQMLTQEQWANHPDGIKANLEYGWRDGKILSPRYNFYHKPQLSLNHFWNIDGRSSLSTAIYASIAQGGGRRLDGKQGKDADGKKVYYTNWIEAYNGVINPAIAKRTGDGLVDWSAVWAANAAQGDNGSNVILGNSINSHQWYGLLSTYRNRIDENYTITAGFDGRYYIGNHTKEIYDLLGGKYYTNSLMSSQVADGRKHLGVGDIYDYHNLGKVLWTGIFAQGEFTSEDFDAFLSGSVTYEGFRYVVPDGYRQDTYKTMKENERTKDIADRQQSPMVNFVPFSIKAGASYKFLDYNNFFFNIGYFTKAPKFAGAFLNYSTEVNENLKNEKIFTAELGYGLKHRYVNVNLNGYYTKWSDRFMRVNSVLERNQFFNYRGLGANHYGVELDVEARPVKELTINGMFSWGNWLWGSKAKYDVYDEAQKLLSSGEVDLKGVHVGNAAQITAALSIDWEMFHNLHIKGTLNYFGKNYADFEPTQRIQKNKQGELEAYTGDSWKMPNYALVDLYANYRFPIYDKVTATLFGGVNNLCNKKYISDAVDGRKVDTNGVRTGEDARVYYGIGRTWSLGMRLNF